VAQVVECLTSKHETLSSKIQVLPKKKKKEKERKEKNAHLPPNQTLLLTQRRRKP
jgi:hypothetical protein